MGLSRQEHWRELPYSPPGGLPDPGMGPVSPVSPVLAGGSFTPADTWEGHSLSLGFVKTLLLLLMMEKRAHSQTPLLKLENLK